MTAPARILKGAAPLPARRVEAAVFEADRRGREMVAAAEEEARRILAGAEAARTGAIAEARAEGHAEGRARAAAVLAQAAAERDRMLRDAEREVVSIALAVARKVLGRELATPGAVIELAAAALTEARARREVVLRVNPGDAAAIRGAGERLAAVLVRAPLEIREDPAVAPGGAVVDTEVGRVDAGIESQLAAVARAVAEALA